MNRKEIWTISTISVVTIWLSIFAGNATGAERGRYGGTFVQAMSGDAGHLNPVLTTDQTAQSPGCQIYNTLLDFDTDLSFKPYLAESWDISNDGKVYTFYLVRNATFHDGTPMTSADVKFTVEEVVLEYAPRGKLIFGNVESIETPDPYTIVFKLKTAFPPFLIGFTPPYFGGVLPKHLWEGTDIETNPHNQNPVGTGPFKFVEYVPGSHITLVRNENYWREGLPYLDRIIFKIIPDATARVLALEKGEVDAITEQQVPHSQAKRLSEIPGIDVSFRRADATNSFAFMAFNLRNPITGNIQVRHAIAHALDTSYMVATATFGFGGVATGPISSASPYYNPDVSVYEYDPEKARDLLEEALDLEAGERISLTLNVDGTRTDHVKYGEIIRSQLKEIGIDVTLQATEKALYLENTFVKSDFDLAIVSMGLGPDPDGVYRLYHSSHIVEVAYQNSPGYSNARVDELLDNGRVETDLERRKEMYREFQDIVLTDLPTLPIRWNVDPMAWRNTYFGCPYGMWQGRTPADEVYWTQGSVSSPEEAMAAISAAKEELDELGKEGYDVSAGLDTISRAESRYAEGKYDAALELAEEAPRGAVKPTVVETTAVTTEVVETMPTWGTGLVVVLIAVVVVVAIYAIRAKK